MTHMTYIDNLGTVHRISSGMETPVSAIVARQGKTMPILHYTRTALFHSKEGPCPKSTYGRPQSIRITKVIGAEKAINGKKDSPQHA